MKAFAGLAVIAGGFGLCALIPTLSYAATPLTGYVSLGSRNANVTNLQGFLATDSEIYPAGSVTGYFGPLTQAAVVQFQLRYDINPIGVVGPATMAKINSVINSNYGIDYSSPVMSAVNVTVGSGTATLAWSTNELATGKVFYSTSPMTATDATTSFTEPYISGSVMASNMISTNQTITLQSLQHNTTYYYMIESIDQSGNVSVYMQHSFNTGN